MNEICYVLIGHRRRGIWHGRLRQRQMGSPASVEFDWAWVMEREERYGDVAGFLHTHPAGLATPSQRDLRTMRAWVSCFGKPLLCLIESGDQLSAHLFASDDDAGRPIGQLERFPRNVIVAVE
jgi:proteasome lid subunit RPN8/RPN11